ncbi:hypothetical protein Bca101_057548 [Brassica carinata]
MSNKTVFPIFPAPCVGGRAGPYHPSADLFSLPMMSPGATLEASSEAVPRAPLRHRRFHLSDEEDDDGPRSDVGEGDLVEIRRRFLIPESVELRCAGEFERDLDGGTDEVAIFEVYREADSRGGILSLIAEVSSYFPFYPSQLTPSTWRTMIAIQVLGELHGIPFGVSKILYSYSFVPLMNKKGFYHIRSRDGEPLVNEPPRGVRGGFSFGDLWNKRYGFMKVNGTSGYPLFWRSVGGIPRASISLIYNDYHKTRSWKRQPYFPLVPRAGSLVPPSITPSMSFVQDRSGGDRPIGLRRRVPPHEEVLFLRSQIRDVVSHQVLVVKRARAFAHWELMKEWSERNISHWDPDGEYRRLLSLGGGGTWTGGFPPMAPPSNGFRP